MLLIGVHSTRMPTGLQERDLESGYTSAMRFRPSLPLLALALATSCSVDATMTLSPTGAAEVSASFAVSRAAQDAWDGLRALDDTLPSDPLSSTTLKRNLGPQGRVTTIDGQTKVALSVPDLNKFLTWKMEEGRWEATIDRTVVRRWIGLTAWADSPAVDSLVPGPGASISEGDYRDLLVYLLGPGTPEALAKTLVDASKVQLTIVAPRPLSSAPGATSVTDRTAVYRWPLVRVLTLEKPLVLSLIF